MVAVVFVVDIFRYVLVFALKKFFGVFIIVNWYMVQILFCLPNHPYCKMV